MLTRFAILSLFLAANIPGCKKNPTVAGGAPLLNPSPTPVVAAAPVATPVPTPAKPVIDQTAQVVIFGYHRFEKQSASPGYGDDARNV